jgi:tetratricopeptide (TPR) repeat protein
MAKKQSKVKPFISRVNPESLTRKELQSITKSKNINQYDYSDSVIETPFGVIKMRKCSITDLEYGDNMPIIYDFNSIAEAVIAEDWVESVILLEKAIEKHPKAILFYFQLDDSYTALKEYGKAGSIIEKNYALHKGLPLVDIAYRDLGSENGSHDYFLYYDEKQYNIHDVYPKHAHFHPAEIVEFYCHLGESALIKKNITIAEQCSEIAKDADPTSQKVFLFKNLIVHRKNPIKTKLKLLFGFGVLLSIIGLIIWGIYRLFAWIF